MIDSVKENILSQTPKATQKVAECTDKQNALRRECTFKIEIVLEIGVGLSDVLARLAQSVRPWRMIIDFYQ